MSPEQVKKASLLIDAREKFQDMLNAGVGQKIEIKAEASKSITKGGRVDLVLNPTSAKLYTDLINTELESINESLSELGVE